MTVTRRNPTEGRKLSSKAAAAKGNGNLAAPRSCRTISGRIAKASSRSASKASLKNTPRNTSQNASADASSADPTDEKIGDTDIEATRRRVECIELQLREDKVRQE